MTHRLRMMFFVFILTFCVVNAQSEYAYSKDSTLISYNVYGSGEIALVFVHGWSCDSRYWNNQISEFTDDYTVVTLDLAGHGHSGSYRTDYTMQLFGHDIKAVVDAVGAEDIILIGHSMGGPVAVEAAKLMPNHVKGIIGIDTFGDVTYKLTEESLNMMLDPMKADFKAGITQFVSGMFHENADPITREWILADMSNAIPSVAISAVGNLLQSYITGYMAESFHDIKVPVITVSGDLWPINVEANKKHIANYDTIIVKDADHFLMLNKVKEFNTALKLAIDKIN